MKAPTLWFAGLCAALISGCAASRQYVALPDQTKRVEDLSKGRLYVLRPDSGFFESGSLYVSDDGKLIGRNGSGGFLSWERLPGDTIITGVAEGTSRVPVSVQAGKVYYILQHIKMGFISGRNELKIIDEEKGTELLRRCQPPKLEAPPPSPVAISTNLP